MPKRSLFNQFNQIRGTRTFQDTLTHNGEFETVGTSYLNGTLAVVSGSATVTDSSNAFGKDELNSFIVIDEGDAAGVYTIVSGTNTFTCSVSPTPTGTDATASYKRHYYQNLEDDLNYLRTMLNSVIGEDSWYDRPNTDLKNMAYLVPKTPNLVGDNTQYPGVRSGDVGFTLTGSSATAFVSDDLAAGEYSDNTSSTTAGTSLRFVNNNTMVLSIAGGFYPADQGVLRIMQDGAVVGELDLAAAWTADGCALEETEDDVGDNPVHTSTHTGIDIIDLSNRRCMNTTVDSFSSFWPPYQMASMSATLTLRSVPTDGAGFVGQISVVHTLGGSDNYTYGTFFVDTTSTALSPAVPAFAENTAVTKYLSGVPYYTTGSTFDVSFTHNVAIFDRGYVANPVTLNLSEFNASNQSLSTTALGLSNPVGVAETIGTYSDTAGVTVGAATHRDMDARATTRFYGVFSDAPSSSSAAGTYRIDTYGTTSTATVEYFDDENKRFDGTEDFTDTGITWGDSTWDSTDDVTGLTEAGLVVYNGTLKYPTIDHSTGFLPVGPDYTGQTGDHVYYRVFTATGAFLQGSITFSGWSNALSVVQGSNVEVYLRLPNCSDYGDSNTNVWQDLAVTQASNYGANGCLGGGSSGSNVAFSFGTTDSSTFGNRIIMKLVYKNSSVTPLTGITFSPTL